MAKGAAGKTWDGAGASWFEVRRAANHQPKTYRCPLCGGQLPALSEHLLLFPEGDHSRRRHAHAECVRRARERGQLPTRAEWRATQAGMTGDQRPGWRPIRWLRRWSARMIR